MAAASPFSGSIGFGYVRSCGKKDSKMFDKSVGKKNVLLVSELAKSIYTI